MDRDTIEALERNVTMWERALERVTNDGGTAYDILTCRRELDNSRAALKRAKEQG